MVQDEKNLLAHRSAPCVWIIHAHGDDLVGVNRRRDLIRGDSEGEPSGCSIRFVSVADAAPGGTLNCTSPLFPAHS